MELFKLFGTIAIENAEANQALDDTTDKAKDTGKSFDDLSSTGEKTESKLNKFFNGVAKVGAWSAKAVAVGVGAATTAMTALTTKALNMGGELEQNMGGSEAVFKECAEGMQNSAKEAFSNMGLSASDFLATANKMGSLFQGAGFSIEESASLSTEAMQRAADVASIMGISTESAMEAIAGAAKGNFTMMDNLGVAMNDTTLNAYALSNGIEKSTSEMTNQEKIGLAMEMFMEKTSYAAGNYAKENETLAGSLGTAKAALSNFLSGAGDVESVVTAFSSAANVIVKNINDLLPRLVNGITDLVNQIVPLIPPLLQSLLPGIIEGAVSLMNGLVAALPLVLDALMLALPGLITGLGQIVQGLIQALPPILHSLISGVVAILPQFLPLLIDSIIGLIVSIISNIGMILQPIIDALPDIIISIVNALMNNLPAIIEGCVQFVVGIVQALPQIILSLIDALPTVISSIVTGLWNALPILLNGVIQMVSSIGSSVWTLLGGYAERLSGFFTGIWEGIKKIFSGVGNWFKNIFKGAFDGIKNVFGGISDWFKGVFDKLASVVKAPVNLIIKGLNALINGVNKISFDVPDWVPVIGGKKFGFNLKQIPLLAKGGVVDEPTPAIFGEDGAEAVVPLEKNTGWIQKIATNLYELTINAQSRSNIDDLVPKQSEALQNQQISVMKVLNDKVDQMIDIMSEYFPEFSARMQHQIVLDTGTLVGATAPAMDRQLGLIYKRKDRNL